MPENKMFCEFCGCGFLLFKSAAMMHGLFCLETVKSYDLSLKKSKKRTCIHKEREKSDRGGYFTIIRETERYYTGTGE